MKSGIIRSVQVGLPRSFGKEEADDPMDRIWTTGFFKEKVAGPVWLGTLNLAGDGQADLVHHGGPDKAVLAYAAEHYPGWQEELGRELPAGAFGENFTVAGLSESSICIGDRWQVGESAVVEVSQPRQPCWKLARRWRIKTLALRVQETGRTGWYFRVRNEGTVVAGDSLVLLERPFPEWTIQRANRIMHHDQTDFASAAELAGLTTLSANWKETLQRRIARQTSPDVRKRLIGQNEDSVPEGRPAASIDSTPGALKRIP